MKDWMVVRTKEDFDKLKNEMGYTGEYPKEFPCLACPRISTDKSKSIDIYWSSNLEGYSAYIPYHEYVKLARDWPVLTVKKDTKSFCNNLKKSISIISRHEKEVVRLKNIESDKKLIDDNIREIALVIQDEFLFSMDRTYVYTDFLEHKIEGIELINTMSDKERDRYIADKLGLGFIEVNGANCFSLDN